MRGLALQWPSTHGPRADQPYFFKANQLKGHEIRVEQGAVSDRVKHEVIAYCRKYPQGVNHRLNVQHLAVICCHATECQTTRR